MELYCREALCPATSSLDFSFGYLRVYRYQLYGQTLATHFTQLGANPPSARDLSSPPGEKQAPLWILSHPITYGLPTLELGPRVIRYISRRYSRYYIDLSTTFEHYLERIGRKKRCELRRKIRKFAASGATSFCEYRSAEEIRRFYELALMVSRRSFQKRIGHGLPEEPGFISQLIRLAEQDGVRAYLLFCDQRPAAFMLCYINGSWLMGERCGYDSSLRHLSPGNALIGHMLQRLFAERKFRMFDFGPGEAEYKAFFACGSIPCADVYYFRRNLPNLALVIAHSGSTALWRLTSTVLDLLHVKDRLKRFARNGWKRAGPSHSIGDYGSDALTRSVHR